MIEVVIRPVKITFEDGSVEWINMPVEVDKEELNVVLENGETYIVNPPVLL